jgi:hypothetical protein
VGYVFTFRDEAIEIPLYGRKFGKLSGGKVINQNVQVDYARDRVIIHLEPGKVYSFENKDEGDSIELAFIKRTFSGAEGDINYVN